MRLPRFNRAVIGWVAVGALSYGVFLLAYLPATFAASAIGKVSQGRISIATPTGTAWHGRGVITLRGPSVAPVSLGVISWELHLSSLFLARLRVDTRLADGPVTGSVSIVRTIRSLQLRALTARTEAAQLAQLYPLLRAADLEGQLEFTAPWIRLSRHGLHADAKIVWRGAGSANFGMQDLGDYGATVHGDNGPLRIVISTLKGDVVLNGEGSWQTATDGRAQLTLTIEPGARRATLEPLLQSLAKPTGDGRYRFNFTTTVSLPRLL